MITCSGEAQSGELFEFLFMKQKPTLAIYFFYFSPLDEQANGF